MRQLRTSASCLGVADVNRRGSRQSLHHPFQRSDAPVSGIVHVDIEGRFVELNDVDAVGLQCERPISAGVNE